MRVLIVGSRDAPAPIVDRVRATVAFLPDDALILSGGGGNVDQAATAAARERGLAWEEVPALWQKYGKAAGPRRNAEMVTGWWRAYTVTHRRFVATVVVRHGEGLVVKAPPILTSKRTAYARYLNDWPALSARLMGEGAGITLTDTCPRPDLAFAFHDGRSPGTKGTLDLLAAHGVPARTLWLESA